MAEAFSRDRLQPALLDRLIDDEPHSKVEPVEARAITRAHLRQSVLRDLSWLFNAQAALDEKVDEVAFAHALHSTLNYGMPPLAGMLVSKVEMLDLENALRQAILDFEPRILPDSLTVRGLPPRDPLGHHNVLTFEITGRLWAQPYPLELMLKTDLDLETGMVELRDRSGSTVQMIDQAAGDPGGR
jgi:type VI secretion system protein ImpF